MKPSTIALATLLIAPSSAADRTTPKLKKRVLQEDAMSIPLGGAAPGEDKVWWPSPETPGPAPGCGDIQETACNGRSYLKLVTGDELDLVSRGSANHVPWTSFYEATPDGCVLAPMDTPADLLNAQAAVAPREINAWVGLYKDAADICPAGLLSTCPSDSGNPVNENNWRNLDGTLSGVANAPYFGSNRNNVWRLNEPNNSPAVQQYAHLFYTAQPTPYLLRDDNDQGSATDRDDAAIAAAVYKCCDKKPLVTFPTCAD